MVTIVKCYKLYKKFSNVAAWGMDTLSLSRVQCYHDNLADVKEVMWLSNYADTSKLAEVIILPRQDVQALVRLMTTTYTHDHFSSSFSSNSLLSASVWDCLCRVHSVHTCILCITTWQLQYITITYSTIKYSLVTSTLNSWACPPRFFSTHFLVCTP